MTTAQMNKPTAAEKAAALHEQLLAQIATLTSGEEWREYLAACSRFHRYSAGNIFLILAQRPDASRVAGFNTWKKLGRQVKRGERGIAILAPVTYRDKREADDTEREQETPRVLRGFRVAYVFDVSQTEGAELPEVAPRLLTAEGPTALWDGLAEQVTAAGYRLERGDCGGANGTTDVVERVIRIRSDVAGSQAAKTLAHELAHTHLHTDVLDYVTHRDRCEVEAESVAYIVLTALGVACDDYSLPYVASWSAGQPEVVRQTAARVVATATVILDQLLARDANRLGEEL